MTHSPEPDWKFKYRETSGDYRIYYPTGGVGGEHYIADVYNVCHERLTRIVACVNACKGLKTEDLTAGKVSILHDMTQDYEKPLHHITGNKEQVIEHAIELLEEEGYTVKDNFDP